MNISLLFLVQSSLNRGRRSIPVVKMHNFCFYHTPSISHQRSTCYQVSWPRAKIEEQHFLAFFFFWMTDGLQPYVTIRRKQLTLFFCDIVVVYLGHGRYRPVADLFFSKSFFGREVLSSQSKLRKPRDKSGAPLSRSTRRHHRYARG